MATVGENIGGQSISLATNHLKKGSRNSLLGTTVQLLTTPAQLKVLVGAPKVMLLLRAVSDTEAKGMCCAEKRAMSAWISSLTTNILCAAQKSARRWSVSFGQQRPLGL